MKRNVHTRIKIWLVIILLFTIGGIQAQTRSAGVGIGTMNPDYSAILDLRNGAGKGLLIEQVSLTDASIPAPVPLKSSGNLTQGLLIYNTNTSISNGLQGKGFYYWDSTDVTSGRWLFLSSYQPGWLLTGNTGINSGTNFLGTTDNISLRVKTNSVERMVVDSVGNIGIGLTNIALKGAKVRLQADSSVLFGKDTMFTTGPATTKFYWNAVKGALRAGTIASRNWNSDSVGQNSMALGYNCKAIGDYSVAMGGNSTASGPGSLAIGGDISASNVASAQGSVALGRGTTASNYCSFAMGAVSKATGGNAVAIGSNNTASGSYSAAIGNNCSSTATGSVAMGNGDTATNASSIAIGLANKSLGYGSIAMGNSCYADGASAGGAIALGAFDSATAKGSIAIGQNTYSSGAGGVALGSFVRSIHQGALMIGDNITGAVSINSSGANQMTTAFSGGYRFLTSRTSLTSNGMFITTTGQVGIGNSAPAYPLDVIGDINAAGSVRASGVALTSDIRYKKNITGIQEPLSIIKALRGAQYEYRTDEFPSKNFSNEKQLGVIAQEVEKVLPELVSTDKEGYKSVNYIGLIPVLIEGSKAQQIQIDTLQQDALKKQATINTLQSELDSLKKQMAEIQSALKK
ncbi:tail fiber domain-containing protein [Chitinophagaceae bacterium LWZ2-11]